MMDQTFPEIEDCTIRAGYRTAAGMRQAFQRRWTTSNSVYAPGYIPPVACYRMRGSVFTIALRETDLPLLAGKDTETVKRHLSLIVAARCNIPGAAAELDAKCKALFQERRRCDQNVKLTENRFLVTSLSEEPGSDEQISSKGAMLARLYREGFPVPDFSILTAELYSADSATRERLLTDGLHNLESLTGSSIGSDDEPLLVAIRCAMPFYIPGFMPTYLNTGVTEAVFSILAKWYGRNTAVKIYLNNLKNIYRLLFPNSEYQGEDYSGLSSQSSAAECERAIDCITERINKKEPALLRDPWRQIQFLMKTTHDFFENNQDLLLTFTRGKRQYPSLILQKMVLTVCNEKSYSGILNSRHPRTGRGMLIECAKNIFGEEIMTGTVQSEQNEFFDPSEIQDSFPAVYHFVPLIKRLEKSFASAVTVEFAAETDESLSSFALLQLNPSEMTGRATLVSAMDMYNGGSIAENRLTELIKPYHLRQIISDSIHEDSFSTLKFFSKGVSLLPRTAISAQVYFSAATALEAKRRGEKVCFCKQSFIPSDTIVMGEMDAMISLNPAAIHVITACRGAGIPAFLNLESFGVSLQEQALYNRCGQVMREGDWITVSSKRQEIFLGRATYTPARFQKYLDGERMDLSPREKMVFEIMEKAYRQYRNIIRELKAEQIENINDLIRLVRNGLRSDEQESEKIVNGWYTVNPDYYLQQVLQCEMGAHLEQSMIFDRLSLAHRIDFFKRATKLCRQKGLSGFMAGAFMLGRFLSNLQTVDFWMAFGEEEIRFVLNEWVLFEKYMRVLYEVGERRISRAREKILNEGLGSVRLNPGEMKHFITLKLTGRDLGRVKALSAPKVEQETPAILDYLCQPFGAIYNYDEPWQLEELRRICAQARLTLPDRQSS